MSAAFAPIDLSTVAEPADLADILTDHLDTPEFNKVVAEFAAMVEGLRAQSWPIVASEDDPKQGDDLEEVGGTDEEAGETEPPEESEGTPAPEQPEDTPAPAEEAPAEQADVAE
jgi:hypothetical protein